MRMCQRTSSLLRVNHFNLWVVQYDFIFSSKQKTAYDIVM